MSKIQFIARCDDLGSSQSANRAIDAVTRAGLFKNVSVMAPGPAVAAAADLMKHRKDICFGMHVTLNAEWDKIKWKPVSDIGQGSGLLDENGFFLPDSKLFLDTKPAVETIMKEVTAQLETLHKLGFDIKHIDSHMFPELYVPGLDDAMREFAQRKGLVDHMHFYRFPPGLADFGKDPSHPLQFVRSIPAGQYFYVAHPALDSAETRNTGNATVSGADIAKARSGEAKLFSSRVTTLMLRALGISGIRYDEAAPMPRLSPEELAQFLQ